MNLKHNIINKELTFLDLEKFSIALIWLFHLSGIIGISLGFEQWFITKTPLNLSLAFILLAINFPLNTARKLWLTAIFFAVGMFAEWIGVHQGFLFGNYSYGSNLGPKIDGVPLLIGINWALLVLITGEIANTLFKARLLRVLLGAALMVFLDLFLEYAAPIFDFWTFSDGIAPLKNYIAWYLIAAFLHGLFQWFDLRGNFRFSLHLYLAQLLFFAYFFWML